MRRSFIQAIFLLIIISLTGVFLYQQKESFKASPFTNEFLFEDVSNAIVDHEGNVFVIAEEKRKIYKLNRASTVIFQVSEQMKDGSSYEYVEMTIDQRGQLYILKLEYYPYSDYIQSESIIRYDLDGSFDAVVYSLEHALGDEVMSSEIKSINMQRDQLEILTFNGKNIAFYTASLADDEIETVFQLEADSSIYEVVGESPETVVYTTKNGRLYTYKQRQNSVLDVERGVLEKLTYGMNNKVYFFDRNVSTIFQMNVEDFSITPYLDKETTELQGYSFSLADLSNIAIMTHGSIVVSQPNRVTVLDEQRSIEAIFDRGLYSQEMMFKQWFAWLLAFIFVAITIFTIRFIYVHVLYRRVYLVWKQAFIFLCLIIIGSGVLVYSLYEQYVTEIEEEGLEKVTIAANVLERTLDRNYIQNISSSQDYLGSDYVALRNHLNYVTLGATGRVYKLIQGELYTIIDKDVPMFTPVELTADREVVVLGQQIDVTTNEDGSLVALRPLYSHSGEIIGLLEVVASHHMINKKKDEFRSTAYRYMAVTVCVLMLIFLLVTAYSLYPMRKLSQSINEITKGRWETATTIRTTDEIAILSDKINRMSEYVKDFIDKMTELNMAYFRFVPKQFLQYLGKESVVDLQLGDQTEQEKTIFVLKVRSFFSYTKNLTPDESFSFINFFLSRFSPIIQVHDGLINRYLGAGVLSFFSVDSKQALRSAIQIRKELTSFNVDLEQKGYLAIDVGIGIHKGSIMLGVIGEKDRLEGAAISDHVNLTEVLESISATLGASILVTEDVIHDLKESNEFYYRALGIVNVSERNEPISLYDVYHGDPEHIFTLKEETKDLFEEGIIMYQDGRFFDARTNFVEVIKKNPYDKTAKLYFYLCDEFYQKGAPRNWNGTLTVN